MLSEMTKEEVIGEYVKLRKLVIELLCQLEDVKEEIDRFIIKELE